MIDLHIHTKYSDGTNTVKEILELAEEKKLEVISITDHNSCEGYVDLENIEVEKYYKGEIIKGIEINTEVLEVPIEILVYNYDIVKMKNLLKDMFCPKKEQTDLELEHIYNICIENNITLPKDFIEKYEYNKYPTEYVLKYIKEDLEKNKRTYIDRSSIQTSIDFYRNHICNPNSIFYMNPKNIVPNIKEIIKEIRKTGGKIFIAHVYEYKENAEKIIKYVVDECDVDGFECYHSTFSLEQMNYLEKLCNDKNLKISGGSDYHGLNKPKIYLGTGIEKGNLKIEKSILDNW